MQFVKELFCKKRLEPCPFCDGEAKLREGVEKLPYPCQDEEKNIFYVQCTQCGCAPFPKSDYNIYPKSHIPQIESQAEQQRKELMEEAVKAWNYRGNGLFP